MTEQETNTGGLELLARHEATVGDLYQEYSKKFPEHKEFWLRLNREEQKHAQAVRDLLPKVNDGTIKIAPDRFKKEVIEGATSRVISWIKEARGGNTDMVDALANALVIENSLVEKTYYLLYENDSEEMKKTFSMLVEASREHRKKVVQLLNAFHETLV
jgi:rubrerythrin